MYNIGLLVAVDEMIRVFCCVYNKYRDSATIVKTKLNISTRSSSA